MVAATAFPFSCGIPLLLLTHHAAAVEWNMKSGYLEDRYSALGLFALDDLPGTMRPMQGFIKKSKDNPVLVQDSPWENRLDNGYPFVIYDPESEDSDDRFRIWYNNCISSPSPAAPNCTVQTLNYARSKDGLTWEKPDLGVFDLSDPTQEYIIRDELRQYGSHNNIIMLAFSVGVYDDQQNVGRDSSCRFKAFGQGQFLPNAQWHNLSSGVACSKDGVRWTDGEEIRFKPPQRYDTQDNVIYHAQSGEYLYTTRDWFMDTGDVGRSIAITKSVDGDFHNIDTSALRNVLNGTNDHQLYAQVTFPFMDIYMGFVMVYDTESSDGEVHMRLSYSMDGFTDWSFVEATPTDFIPLGDLERCKELNETGDFNEHDCFDSHVIFGSQPVVVDDDGDGDMSTRLYYIGGDGPHSGWRNSSLGFATVPSFDRIAGIGGSTSTDPSEVVVVASKRGVKVTGPTMTITADGIGEGASIQVGCNNCSASLSATSAIAIDLSGRNVTSEQVKFQSADDFTDLIGQYVQIETTMTNTILYSIGFE